MTTNQGNDMASFNDETSVEDEALTDRGDQVRDWVPKTMVFKRGKRIRKGPGMPCVD